MDDLSIAQVKVSDLKPAAYNPRSWDEQAVGNLTESIKQFGLVDPLVVNGSESRKNVVIGGHFRLHVAKQLGFTNVPVVYLDIADELRERELNLRLNKNQGAWDMELLAEFDETLLRDIGFESGELDTIFDLEIDEPDSFDLDRELKKLNIPSIAAQKGDIYQLGDSRLMVGDSTVADDMKRLMNNDRADMTCTDPPYRLSYTKGGMRHGKPVEAIGAKRSRKYLETDELPEDFTEKWMDNVATHAHQNHSILVFEAWHNLREIWDCMETHWKVRNMIVWHLPNRYQGFNAKYKFFSKYDGAMLGASGEVAYNSDPEEAPLQETYKTALYATSGSPHWEGYQRGKVTMPTDFIEFNADDLKHSGQEIVFGTKPIEVLLPYIKVLTRRGDLVLEPFCGSGSTLIACTKLKRRCFLMEKSPVYAEVAMKRWENLTGQKRVKL